MKKLMQILLIVGLAGGMGCATVSMKGRAGSASFMAPAAAEGESAEVRSNRMLIWKAHISLEVGSVSNAVAKATALVERQGGFLETKSDHGEESADVTFRIPAGVFQSALAGLETLGRVTYRHVEGEDVTEQYVDIDARLKNKIVLRDRLKQLLDKAVEVKDILAIETELNRVQGDIDSMEARIKALKGQVDYATVTLRLERKSIPGPLGFLFKGIWWCVEKLFVIQK